MARRNATICTLCVPPKRFKTREAKVQHSVAVHNTNTQSSQPRRRRQRQQRTGQSYAPVNTGRPINNAIHRAVVPLMAALSPAGRDFAMRALHPNDDSAGGGVFMPDQTTVDRAVSENRHFGVIGAPEDVGDSLWDCEVLVLPLADAPIVWRTRKSGGPWRSSPDSASWQYLIGQDSVQPGRFQLAQPAASPQIPAAVITQPMLLKDTTQFRQTYRGLTIVQDASALTNQGFVTAGQWGNKAKAIAYPPQYGDGTPSSTDFHNITHLQFDDVPQEVNDIILQCPEAGQWEARRGIYLPARFEDPVSLFNGGAEDEWRITDTRGYQKTGHPILLQPVGQTTGGVDSDRYSGNIVYWSDTGTGTGETPIQAVTSAGAINQAFGCVLFTGLHSQSSLVLKARSGLESVPQPDSPAAPYVLKNVTEDEPAIKAVTAISARLPVVYEHKYNSLGMLLPLIGKAAAAVLPTVLPWLAGKAAGFFNNVFFGGRRAPRRQIIEEDVD